MRERLPSSILVSGAVLALAALAVVSAAAQIRVPDAAYRVRSAPIQVARVVVGQPLESGIGAFMPLPASRRASIFGIVQNQVGELVPHAGDVVIRELRTGRIVARTAVDDLAQFSVRNIPTGLYVADLVDASGGVIASTGGFTAGVGEVIRLSQTIPVMPLSGFGRAVSSATSMALSSAANAGVLALATETKTSPIN